MRLKSQLEPVHNLVYLGACFDIVQTSISLPDENIPVSREKISLLLASHFLASLCLKVVGKLVSTIPIGKLAQWWLFKFQCAFLCQWTSRSHHQTIAITQQMKCSPWWWINRANLTTCHYIIHISWMKLSTDANLTSWGAHIGTLLAQRHWNFNAMELVSNALELQVGHCAPRASTPQL